MAAYTEHNAPILLPGASQHPGYEVWQIEGSESQDGPWLPVNAGISGAPLRARFPKGHHFWRVLWTAYSGAVLTTPPQAIPGGSTPHRRGGSRIRLVR